MRCWTTGTTLRLFSKREFSEGVMACSYALLTLTQPVLVYSRQLCFVWKLADSTVSHILGGFASKDLSVFLTEGLFIC